MVSDAAFTVQGIYPGWMIATLVFSGVGIPG